MVVRLDNPGKPNKEMSVSYSNKGSVVRLKNYLIKNEDKYDTSDMFFTAIKDNVSAEEFFKMIDTNVKGLEKDEHKFYSFTMNPDAEELRFIDNDKEKLKEFVRASMGNLHKLHQTVTENDQPVWAAIIHQNRIYTEADIKRAKEENAKIKLEDIKLGQVKKGDNTHIHIVLSARDATQKKTITLLTPKNKTSRNFQLTSFQRDIQRLFQNKFNYRKGERIYENRMENAIKKKIEAFNKKYYSTYDIKEIIKSADKMDWSSKFMTNLSNMFRELIFEKQIISHPTIYLEQGRKYYNKNLPEARVSVNKLENSYTFKDNTSSYQHASSTIADLCNALQMEGIKQETKGYDLIKNEKKENNLAKEENNEIKKGYSGGPSIGGLF
jgi:hypothetical protein